MTPLLSVPFDPAPAGSGIFTRNQEERDLADDMRAAGRSTPEIENALRNLRERTGRDSIVVDLVLRAPDQPPHRTRINYRHIFEGDVSARPGSKAKTASGGHYRRSGNVRIVEIVEPEDSFGVLKAKIEVRDPLTGRWVRKKRFSTFFPANWSKRRMRMEIEGAFSNSRPGQVNEWEGISPSGILMRGFYSRPFGDAATAWPVHEADQ